MANEEKKLHVTFYMDTKENKRKSEEAGRPIFDEVEKVTIRIPGDRLTVIGGLAHDKSLRGPEGRWLTYAERFPEHYEAFKKGLQQHGSGTPLSELPFMSVAKVKELQAVNIWTAEAFASLDGDALRKLGRDAREMRNKAKAYIDNAAGFADVAKISAENDALKARLEALEAKLAGTPTEVEPAVKPVPQQSPFDNWADEDIVAWMNDNGGVPDGRWKRNTLLEKAAELNAQIGERKAS